MKKLRKAALLNDCHRPEIGRWNFHYLGHWYPFLL